LHISSSRQQQQQQQQRRLLAGGAAVGKGTDAGAPSLFRFKGKWYLMAAQKSGW
jgi:hypothetical protein